MMGARMQQRMAEMPPEQREQGEKMQRMIAPITGYVGAIIGAPLFWLIAAALLILIVKVIMSVPVTFKQVYSIVAYAALPVIIQTVLKIVVMQIKRPDDYNIMNPLVFNPAAFMDPATSSKFVYVLALGFDVFTFWTLLLTAVGLKAAGGKRLSFAGALTAVLIPWATLLLIGAGIAGAFG